MEKKKKEKKDSVLDADAVVSRPPFVKAWLTHSLSLSLSLTSRAQVKEELEEARRESANAEAEVSDLRQEIDRIQVRQRPRPGAADLRANEPS